MAGNFLSSSEFHELVGGMESQVTPWERPLVQSRRPGSPSCR